MKSSSSSDSNTNDGDQRREEMLKALASRTLEQFEIDGLSSSEDDQSDQNEEEEEWGGIPSESDDENYSVAGTDLDFDDAQDLLQQSTTVHHQPSTRESSQKEPEIIVFTDPSRTTLANPTDRELSQLERNSFMASTLGKQNRVQADSSDRKGKRKHEDEEAKLSQLDRSLSNLVAHLTAPKKKTGEEQLDEILSTTLPPLSRESKNEQRHPRRIKAGMARAELARSLAADKQALVSGTVRAANAKTISKRQTRAIDGSADRIRRIRKGQTDRIPIGKSAGGGLIKLSSRDIRNATNPSTPHSGKSNKGKR